MIEDKVVIDETLAKGFIEEFSMWGAMNLVNTLLQQVSAHQPLTIVSYNAMLEVWVYICARF